MNFNLKKIRGITMKKFNLFLFVLLVAGLSFLQAQVPAPTNLTAEFKQYNYPHPGHMDFGYVELKWQMPQLHHPNFYFKIFRKGPNDSTFKAIMTFWRGLEYHDYMVKPQSTYSYYVVAFNNSGISDPSNIATVTTPQAADIVRFTTHPPKQGSIGQLYSYDADAVSNDSASIITYYLVEGPADLTIDSVSGLVSWTPNAGGYFKVKIKAESNLGGKAFQEWTIKVLGPTGTVSGVVSDESNNLPVENATVYFLNINSNRHEVAFTNSNGEFLKFLVEGNYKVRFYKRGYLPEFFNNQPSIDLADTITVTANQNLTINASLTPIPPPVLYTISGSVLDSNGLPVRSIVTAFVVRDTTFPTHHPNFSPRHMTAITDSFGNYSLRVLGGFEYVVYAKPFNRNYYPEFWDNKRTFNEADRILVNDNVSNINFVMDLKPVYNNGVSGLVKDFNNGTPVEAIVSAFKLTNGRFKPFKSVRTDSTGNYLIENLEPGNYILHARPRLPYLPGYYKQDTVAIRWRDADTVVVTESGIVSGLDINLITRPDTGFAKIAGTVKTILGDNVAGATVFAININGEVSAYTNSSSDGSYSFETLPAGEYTLIVDNPEYENTADNEFVSVDYGNNSVKNKDILVSPASTTGVIKNTNSVPTSYSLLQNYPNPFNPSTAIRFTIPERTQVKLEVYNLIGQKIKELINGELEAGQYDVTFDGSNISSGIYLYRIQAGNFSSVKKMLLMK